MKVSFIIPAYNVPVSQLQACVKSIFALSLSKEEREVIVVDDGSQNPVLDHLETWIDDILYVRQPNSGPSVARNRGLDLATGDYIQFVDGDDMLLQTGYEHCLDLVRYHQPVDVVMFGMTRSPHTHLSTSYAGPMTGAAYMQQYNLRGAVWGYVFRKSLLNGLRFTPGKLIEDEEFTAELLLRARNVYDTGAKAYYYRLSNNSRVTTATDAHRQQRLSEHLDIILRLQDKTAHSSSEVSKGLQRRVAQLSMDYLYDTIRLTHNAAELERAIDNLRQHSLYPLPDARYTQKYTIFRYLVDRSWGRKSLLKLL